jgi:hypothetical protein
MDGLQIAVGLNNNGVSLLECNKIQNAIQVFQRAIKEITRYAHVHSTVEEAAMSDDSISSSSSSSLSYHDRSLFSPIRTGMKIEGLQHRYHYTYDRPLLLHANALCPTSNETELVYLVSVVLIFNLALTYHSHARICGLATSQQNAVKMYNLAAKMAESIQNDQWIGRIILCFTLNNLANLHSDLCDYKTCTTILKCIQSSVWDDVDIDGYAMGFIDENEWIEMKLNYIYSQIPSAAQAA